MTLSGNWLILAPLTPLLVSFVLMCWPLKRQTSMSLTPWSAVPALFIALLPWEFSTSQLPGVLLGTQIGLDESGRYFLLLSALVWLVSGLHATKSLARPNIPGFFICFLLAMTGSLGAIIAGGILSFYFSFASFLQHFEFFHACTE